jgi:hypothetical protein
MKSFLKVLAGLLLLLLAGGIGGYFYVQHKFQPAANQLVVSGLPLSSPFVWQADSSARPIVPQAGLLLPIMLPGCPRRCYVQFDTGAPSSVFYAHPLAALSVRYPGARSALLPRADTLHNLHLALGNGQIQARRLRVIAYGAHQLPADTAARLIVGTLGADVLEGRVLVLDYQRQRFSLVAQVPDSLAQRASFVPLAFTGRRLILSAAIAGEPRQLLFDSGSSAFALLTNSATWQQLASPQATAQTTAVNSLGKILTAHTVATAAGLRLGQVTVPLQTVTYMEGTTLFQRSLMRFSGMGGMLGNRPFNQHIILIDEAHQRFGLVP